MKKGNLGVKWVVVFAGSRDRYQVPLALAEEHRLQALVTDFYTPKDATFGRVFDRLPRGLRSAFSRRHEAGLSSKQAKWSAAGLVVDNLAKKSLADRDARLGELAGSLARRDGCGLLSYSYYGFAAFHSYGLDRWPKVLFQVHPHAASVREIFSKEITLSDFGETSLRSEEEFSYGQSRLHQLSSEAMLADHCIVASNFTKMTLVENGVSEDRIHVIPYGVDTTRYSVDAAKKDDMFRVMFVGRNMQRKGVEYLLKAWRKIRLPKAQLTIVGSGSKDEHILAAFRSEIRWLRDVSDGELRQLYCSSDLFCMPSLAEGFGLVYLEALAAGLPVIATPNTGAADVIREGHEGFIVPIRDVEAIAEKLEWAYENRLALAEMKIAARRLAEQYSWARFRSEIAKKLKWIENEGRRHNECAATQSTSLLS